jgi:hypothetical protein
MIVWLPAPGRVATMSYSPATIVPWTIINYGCNRLTPEICEAGIFLIVPVTSDACRTPMYFRWSRPGIGEVCGYRRHMW